MKNLLIIFFVFFIGDAFAQRKVEIFGEISQEEINLTSYEKDKDAKAIVIYDKGKSEFHYIDYNYELRFTRHKRIKIFDKSVKGATEVLIRYYKDGYGKTEKVKDVEAYTYNYENGIETKKKVKAAAIFDEHVSGNWYLKKFVFPDVQDGSILEYKYVIESPFKSHLQDWEFQSEIPTVYSECEVAMIPFYEYSFVVQGTTVFDYESIKESDKKRKYQSEGYNEVIYIMGLNDVPAFKDQNYISTINDYIIKIDFQLATIHKHDGTTEEFLTTWDKLNKKLLKEETAFGYYMKGCKRFANQLLKNEIQVGGLDKKEKAKKLIDYVKTNFEWNGFYGYMASQTPKQFFNKKSGSVADINLFTIALLNEAGIKAQPLLLSTRNHGKIRSSYAFTQLLNYVIVIGEANTTFLSDATEVLLPYNSIPTRCINDKGLIVNDNEEAEWISLECNISSLAKNAIYATLNPETLNLETKISIQNTGYESYQSRSAFNDDTLKIKKYYENKVGDINKLITKNYMKNTSNPYNIFLSGNYETERIGSKIIVKPFLNMPLAENTLEQEKRNYPVDFVFPFNDEFTSNLQIPNSYTIKSLPDDYSIDDDLVGLKVSYSYKNNSLIAEGSCNFKKAVYTVDEYPKLRKHMDMMVKYFNQAVVIEKIVP